MCNALRAVAARRGTPVGCASIGRDGEPADALDGAAKPRIRIVPGTVVALAEGLVPRSPALAILARGGESALGPIVFARAVLPTTCAISGPPTAAALRATIDRLRALTAGVVIVDGALDRIAPLAGGDDAVIVATGAASGATVEAVARTAAETIARLTLPAFDPARAHERVVHIAGALDVRDATALIAGAAGATVVVADPTRVTVRGGLVARLRAAVDLRCERPLRVIACTVSPQGRDAALPPRALVDAVARATALPAFDVVAGLAA